MYDLIESDQLAYDFTFDVALEFTQMADNDVFQSVGMVMFSVLNAYEKANSRERDLMKLQFDAVNKLATEYVAWKSDYGLNDSDQ